MSYILDALKKIEQEKNRKKRVDGKINISGELFNERTRPVKSRPVMKIAAVVLSVTLVASGVIWYLMKGKLKGQSALSRSSVSSVAVANQVAVDRSVVPLTPSLVAPPPVILPPTPAVTAAAPPPKTPVQAVSSKKQPVEVKTQKKAKPVKPIKPIKPIKPLKQPQTAKPVPVQVPSQTVSKKTPPPTVPPPAEIKLSGIAWQDDRGSRRAVINGFLLKEGGVVTGATISEIQYDRVKFTTPEGRFEIRLDSVVPAEVKK